MNGQTVKNGQSTENRMLNALSWAFDQALDPGVTGIYSASDLAKGHTKDELKAGEGIQLLSRWLSAKAATSVYHCGRCGLMTFPSDWPVNISSVIFVQIRTLIAIATIGGYDMKKEKVRTLIYASLCGEAAKKIFKGSGLRFGKRDFMKTLDKMPALAMTNMNRKIVSHLVSIYKDKDLISLGHTVPFLGEAVGETFDTVSSPNVVNIAKQMFIDTPNQAEPFRHYSKAS